MTVSDLSALLDVVLAAGARTWLADAAAVVAADPAKIHVVFPAVRRRCGHARIDSGWTADEAARVVLINAVAPAVRAKETASLYHRGERAERRAVLLALSTTDLGDEGLSLVRDALRSNDSTLIEAALGTFAAVHLPDDEYRQAVLKCVFSEIPLGHVEGLPGRADDELARMLADFARERVAAGRDAPADIWPIVRTFPAATAVQRAAISADLTSDVPARRAAAAAAVAHLTNRADVATV